MMWLIFIVAVIVGTVVLLAISTLVVMMVRFLWKETGKVIEDDHPCGGCVRWSECNGVDDECPRRKNNG